MHRRFTYTLGIAFALGLTLGGQVVAHAGTPDGSSDDPTVQAPAYSVQGPATGLGYAPGQPLTTSVSTSVPSPSVLVTQPPAAPVDTTAVASPFNATAALATAQCKDGWFSFSQTAQGACAGHGGVMVWVVQPPATASAVIASRQASACMNAGTPCYPRSGTAVSAPVTAVSVPVTAMPVTNAAPGQHL